MKSNYKKVVDDFVLRTFENGLYKKHLEWATALLNALFRPPQSNEVGSNSVFTLDMISGVFSMLIVGMVLSSVAFLIENGYIKCLSRLINRDKELNV